MVIVGGVGLAAKDCKGLQPGGDGDARQGVPAVHAASHLGSACRVAALLRCRLPFGTLNTPLHLLPHAPCPGRSTHPNDRGHRAVAELRAAAVARAVEEAQGGGSLLPAWEPGRDEPRLAGLPPPMVPGNADAPTTLCAIQVGARECGGGGGQLSVDV